MNKLLKEKTQLFKVAALYKSGHITDQYFLPRLLEDWEDQNSQGIATKSDLIKELKYATGYYLDGLSDSTNFVLKYWDYFNPNIRRKLKFVFAPGSHLKSVTI